MHALLLDPEQILRMPWRNRVYPTPNNSLEFFGNYFPALFHGFTTQVWISNQYNSVLTTFESYLNRIFIQCVFLFLFLFLFCIWLLLLKIMYIKFIHVLVLLFVSSCFFLPYSISFYDTTLYLTLLLLMDIWIVCSWGLFRLILL